MESQDVKLAGGGGVLCRSSSTEDGGFVCCLSGLLALSGKLTTRGLMLASLPCPCIPCMAEGRLFSRSSTSIWRLFLSDIRWSSPSPNLQVVCPRRCGDGRRGWICVGKERTTSNFLSDLGVPCALRSPASGGEDTQAPDCLLFLCARVLFVILEALSSNIRFYRTIEARGPPCNYVPAAFNGCF
jgi:hypothetical protein